MGRAVIGMYFLSCLLEKDDANFDPFPSLINEDCNGWADLYSATISGVAVSVLILKAK